MFNKYMNIAIKEAKKAYKKAEVPVGAIIVKNGEIIAKAHNLKESKKDTTCHAEILAIKKASKKLNAWRLEDCEMYVTLEPCSIEIETDVMKEECEKILKDFFKFLREKKKKSII